MGKPNPSQPILYIDFQIYEITQKMPQWAPFLLLIIVGLKTIPQMLNYNALRSKSWIG
jgi:hypothetical protein